MSEKKYRITTSTKQFETEYLSIFDLKEENGIFYISERKSDKWQKITKFEKLTSVSDKINEAFTLFFGFLIFGAWIALPLGEFIPIVFKIWGIGSLIWFISLCIMSLYFILCKPKPYFVPMSDIEIQKIVESNKPYKFQGLHNNLSSTNRKYTYSANRHGGRSSSGGGGSFGGGHSAYVPNTDLNKALKEFESEGKDVNALVNDVSDEEREKLFSKYFKDEDKGQYANDKFNQDIAWPARKQTLEKMLNEAEYEDDDTKGNLSEKINNLGEEISNEDFQTIFKEIRTFQERKRAKDNHIKYEGRLSNKDIQAIKEYHGYVCMGCGLDPVEEYGEQMKGILEAHHKIPWANMEDGETRTVAPSDFLILCPNCHRMIHKLKSPDDIDGLKEVLNQNKKSHWWD